jgi:CD151 antigen
MEVLVGGLSYVYETQIEDELNLTLNQTFLDNYGVDDRMTREIDEMQQRYICCSAFRFEDWRNSAWYRLNETVDGRLVPDSCCISRTPLCGLR